jgi:Amiloride-sensitive sodium channel
MFNSSNHIDWFTSTATGAWKNTWSLPFQMILTKWGICFSFNLTPLSEILHLDRYVRGLAVVLKLNCFFLLRVSLDFDHSVIYPMQHPVYPTQILQQPSPWSTSHGDFLYMEFFNFHGNYSNSFEARAGYHLIVHQNYEMPSVTGTNVHFWNQRVIIHIYPDQYLLDDDLKHDSLDKRNCYNKDERNLKLFRIYSKENCDHECQSFAFSRICGCVPFYLISKVRIVVGVDSSAKVSCRIKDGQSMHISGEKLQQ